MATESSTAAANRPRPWLLGLLGLAIAAFVLSRMFSGGTNPAAVPSTPATRTAPGKVSGPVDVKDLDIRIESLAQKAPPLGEGNRNPFRFAPPPAPPPPPVTAQTQRPSRVDPMLSNGGVPPPPPEPRVADTVKFIGIVETARGKIGAFSIWDPQLRECRGVPSPAREGEVIDGRYRVVRLGIESAVVEFVDGRGRSTLPLNGQACVVKQ
jgi:hypothetical protein